MVLFSIESWKPVIKTSSIWKKKKEKTCLFQISELCSKMFSSDLLSNHQCPITQTQLMWLSSAGSSPNNISKGIVGNPISSHNIVNAAHLESECFVYYLNSLWSRYFSCEYYLCFFIVLQDVRNYIFTSL